MRRHRLWILLTALMMVIAACGDGASDDTEAEEESATTEAAAEEEPAEEPEEEEEMEEEEEAEEAPTEFDTLTYLTVNNMAHLPAFVAQEFGLWTDRGLDVTVETVGSGADIASGLQAGQADFGGVNGGTGVAPQRASGLLTKLLAPYNNDATNAKYVDWMSIIGRADAGVTDDPQSTVGLRVGVGSGGTSRAYFRQWIAKNGLTEDDFEIVEMGPPDMLTSIVNGDVDLIVPWDPFRTSALNQLGDNAVEISPGESLVLSVIGTGAVDGQVDEQRDVFKRFIEGIVEATWLIRTNPEEMAPVVLSFVDGVTEEDAIEAIERNGYDPRVSVCTRYGVEVTAAQLVESGSFASTPDGPDTEERPFTADDLIDSRLLDEVIAENPEWVEDLPAVPENVEDCEGYEG